MSRFSLRAFATLSITIVFLFAPGCGQGTYSGRTISTTKGSRSLARQAMITVTSAESGKAISGAKVLIGSKLDSPFAGNFLTLDASGTIAPPSAWTTPQPVTIEAPGFVRTTFFGRTPDTAEFQLKPAPTASINELKGETTNYPNLSKDGYLDVGVVFPTFSRGDVTKLELGSLVSADTDTMSLFGQKFEVPSNLAVPTQSETYILPLTLSKPTYRITYPLTGPQKVAALHARFKVKEVGPDLQKGTPFSQLINKFNFVEGSVKAVTIVEGPNALLIPVNSLTFTPSISITAPNFDAKLMMLTMAVPEISNTYMISDAKRLQPRETRILTAPKSGVGSGLVVSLLKTDSEDITGAGAELLSATITPATRVQAPEFLELVAAPEIHGTTLKLSPPKRLKGVLPAMTTAVLSKVELLQKGNYKLEKKTPEWELYSSDWVASFDLPVWPENETLTGPLRWEAAFSAQSKRSPKSPAGPDVLEKVTHVTRSAIDF